MIVPELSDFHLHDANAAGLWSLRVPWYKCLGLGLWLELGLGLGLGLLLFSSDDYEHRLPTLERLLIYWTQWAVSVLTDTIMSFLDESLIYTGLHWCG